LLELNEDAFDLFKACESFSISEGVEGYNFLKKVSPISSSLISIDLSSGCDFFGMRCYRINGL